MKNYDVIIIGGGAAGLAAGLSLGRALRSVAIVDAGEPRNAAAKHMHNYLGHEGAAPSKLITIGREEVKQYGVELIDANVVSAKRDGDGFEVSLADREPISARRVLLATGVVDELPDVPGLAEFWGKQVHHCPYCHGWEVRGKKLIVLASTQMAMHQVLMWSQWTDALTLVTNNSVAIAVDDQKKLDARGITVVNGTAESVAAENGALVGLRVEGEVVPCEGIIVQSVVRPRETLLADLGVTTTEMKMSEVLFGNYIETDPMTGVTEVPGVYAAGNVTNLSDQVISAAARGVMIGAQINWNLIEEDIALAVSSSD